MRTVRPMDHDDVPGVLHLMHEMRDLMACHVGAGDSFKLMPEKAIPQLHRILARLFRVDPDAFAQVLVDEHFGQVHGVILAERLPDLWSDAYLAMEHVIYITPDGRGTIGAGRLMINYRDWCESQSGTIIRAHAEAGPTNDEACRAFGKLGWQQRGVIYGKEMY